jgi:hypothetical protein
MLDLLPTGSAPSETYYSDYAHGPYGYLTPLSLLSASGGLAALGFRLRQDRAWGRLPRALLVASLCLLVPAALKDDLHGEWETPSGVLHLIFAGAAWIALFYTMVKSIFQLRHDRHWSGLRRSTVPLASIAIPAFLSLPVWGERRGIGQRLFVFPAYAWLLIVGWRAAASAD